MQEILLPFTFEERRPFLGEGFLYIPKYYSDHQSFSLEECFPNKKALSVEFCSGNGEWIIKRARQYSHINWIAVEKRLDRAKKIYKKKEEEKLDNLFVVIGDGYTFAKYYLKEDSLKIAYINFPDPWPKNRHSKHRLIDPFFEEELKRVLPLNHKVIVVTDDIEYRDLAIELFSPFWKAEFPYPNYIQKWPAYGSSFFERLWKGKKREIYYISYSNNKKYDSTGFLGS